jgi:hypothetical protein
MRGARLHLRKAASPPHGDALHPARASRSGALSVRDAKRAIIALLRTWYQADGSMKVQVPKKGGIMNRTETYSGSAEKDRSRMARDIDTWAGNGLATILAGLAIAAGVIGLLVAFGQINEDNANSFEDGMIWLIGGVLLAITANVFRREHHVVDPSSYGTRQPLQGGSEGRGYSSSFDDERHTGSGMAHDEDVRRDDILKREGRNK